jgi:hypothetical protein
MELKVINRFLTVKAWACLLLLHNYGARKSHAFIPSVTSRALTSVLLREMTCNNPSITLVTDNGCSRQIILPGETRTICADDSFDRSEESCKDGGVIAVGFTGEVREDDDDLLEVASLCEIKKYAHEGRMLTLECVGRIKLESFAQFLPCWKFYFSVFEDEHDHIEKCRLVADNIETFIRFSSKSEEIIAKKDFGSDLMRDSLSNRFHRAYERCLEVDITKNQCTDEIRSLTAISWAVFTAVEKENSHMNDFNYRVRALDYDTLFDRLKLAQYMLRERQLRLLGVKLQCDTKDDDSFSNEVTQEGFQ